jgi:hypothetical protein
MSLTENGGSPTGNKFAVCSSLEQYWLVAWAFAVPKGAHSLGGLVVEAFEHLVHLGSSEGKHEPFATDG